MTIIDWMFAHPWMTFFVALALADGISVSRVVVRIRELRGRDAKALTSGLALKDDKP